MPRATKACHFVLATMTIHLCLSFAFFREFHYYVSPFCFAMPFKKVTCCLPLSLLLRFSPQKEFFQTFPSQNTGEKTHWLTVTSHNLV